jgi:2-oxoglutarate dehydrogenase E1 component
MSSLTNPGNIRYLEDLYREFRKNPASVDRAWRTYFADLARESPDGGNGHDGASDIGRPETSRSDAVIAPTLQDQLNEMIRAYRLYGHQAARIDPLGIHTRNEPLLDPVSYGFTSERAEQLFPSVGLYWAGPLKLRDIVERLRRSYCGPLAVEFMHIEDRRAREWLAEKIETRESTGVLSAADRKKILLSLSHAVVFDEFIRSQFVGAKSFSLEGGETLIPLLGFVVEKSAQDGLREIVLAMAHRGRLNVLVNILGKKPRDVFREFIDRTSNGGGDVKYHLGHSSDYQSPKGHRLHLSLCFNPSHLEYVSAVAVGRVRAKQDRTGDARRERGMALLIHGDAAFAGEGIVQETLNLSGLAPYRVGGTLHVIVNNQIGFTTCPDETRSTRYASDAAKILQIPIFHVNGDEPETVLQATKLALDYRRQFKRDAVIDLVCYRRHGHNEGDEPAFTQPLLYRAIARHPPVHDRYLRTLVAEKIVGEGDAKRSGTEYRTVLEQELSLARADSTVAPPQSFGGVWSGYLGGLEPQEAYDTAVPQEQLATLLERQTEFPEGFHPHPKIARAGKLRREMAAGKRPLDWAAAEALAFATLAASGTRIRLTGQDSARGTFSQRHAVLHDFENGTQYVPLRHVTSGQAPVEIYNSPLSEAGVLGFEYGFSLDYPDALVIWEAQFGDFVNAAQVITDQFIASAEEKWHRLSGLVLLLPHGFEGMGPEHSSARLERFLQLCARDNLQVVYPSTPAQYFHCLRRQALRRWRKPLVVMTPKSLLRHPDAVSTLSDLSTGGFRKIIAGEMGAVDRVLLCSGKIFYELEAYRAQARRFDVAIVRIEQLYPIAAEELERTLAACRDGTRVFWVQEEPINMGAACFWSLHFGMRLFDRFPFATIARPAAASPATGSAARHKAEQAQLIAAAFDRQNTGQASADGARDAH